MIRNYLKTAFRNLLHNRSHSIVNITGLVIGFAACLLIFLVIQYEKSFDNFHTKKDRIYRIVRIGKNPVGREYRTGIPFPVPDGLRAEFPQLENAAAIMGDNGVQVLIPGPGGVTEKKFKEDGVFSVEPRFFQMFDFKMLLGNPTTAISEPNTVMITKATAEKYFNDWKSVIGKTIKFYGQEMKITGIMDNLPVNTDFPIKLVLSYATMKKNINSNDWQSIADANNCFIQLPVNYSPGKFEKLLPAFLNKHLPDNQRGYDLSLQPLRDIHFDERFGNFNNRTFSKELITALSLIGLFLLVIACINFINLSTAHAIIRAKEVGVRKVLGGNRGQLLLQFFGETGLACLIALTLAVIIAITTLPMLNAVLETQLGFHFLHNPGILLFMGIVLVGVCFLSGFYPALVLSGFNPINALKSRAMSQTTKGISLRRGLVVIQFVIAQALIIGTLVVVSQMDYFKKADLGFNKTAVINAPFPGDSLSRTKMDVLRDQLVRLPGIKAVSFSLAGPTNGGRWFTDMQLSTNHSKNSDLVVDMMLADSSFFGIYNFQLAAGRIYFSSDTMKEFVVNETFVKKAGLGKPQDAVGKSIRVNGSLGDIVGVVKDFHINSLRDPVDAIVMTTMKEGYGTANISLDAGNTKDQIAAIEGIWNRNYPDFVFEYNFVDQTVADYYKQENQLSKLYEIFSGISIFISCLGLFGLISFMAVRRNKEIGIRKVLGASVGNIVYLLSREFTLLIVISFLIASPIAWYFMRQWLQQYSFRIDMGAGFFLVTIFSSLLIAWLTVGYSAIRAALANPVKSLKTE
ncbi:MAG TPA: ABC transporter permease [Puia sp.]